MKRLNVIFALFFVCGIAEAQCELQKLLGSSVDGRDYFGTGVAISGDTAFVGAPVEDSFEIEPGAVYVFESSPSGWVETQVLMASDGAPTNFFGRAIAVDGDLAVIGAYADDEEANAAGAAYVFERTPSGWVEVQKLTASNATFFSFFGLAVAISGETLLIGAPGANINGDEKGAAYVFDRSGTTWTETRILTALDGDGGDDFGRGVALHGDVAASGAPWHGPFGGLLGAVYFFERGPNGWLPSDKVLPDTGTSGHISFGITIDLEGATAVVGAPTSGSVGAAFVFEDLGAGFELTKRLWPNTDIGDDFGESVAISGDRVLVGSPGSGDNGRAFLFERGPQGWLETGQLIATDGALGDALGYAVALDGDTAVLGANEDGDLGQWSGSAYIHRVGVQVAPYCQTTPNSFGDGALIDALGTTSIATNTFRLQASFAPPAQLGLFFYGPEPTQAPFADGFLCVGTGATGTFRIEPPLAVNAFGRVTRHLDFNAPPASAGAGAIQVASTWFFQLWYRDPAGPGGNGSNLSDGLSVYFCP